MAEFQTKGLEELEEAFLRQEETAIECVEEMLVAGAEILVEAQRAEAASMGINETSGFIQSIKPTSIKKSGTESSIEVYPQGNAPHGNDIKGKKGKVRYATIGFVNEYGTSRKAARPYMTVANEKAEERISQKQFEIWESKNNG
jgi:Bacteriophage protein of unknown function (DUF646).